MPQALEAQPAPLKLPDHGIAVFHLHRHHDVNGHTGVGVVAEGVIFSSGKCVMQWLHPVASVVIFDSIDQLLEIHGHAGKSVVVFGGR